MSTDMEASQEELSRGVIADFVALKLEEHSFQCILTHTENLHQRLSQSQEDVAPAVEAGVLPVLLRILGHHDVRSDAELQRLALKTLILILEKGGHGNYESLVVEAGGIPRLLRLLKLRWDDLAHYVI